MAPAKQLRRALKSAARFPLPLSRRSTNNASSFAPSPGETPLVLLRVQVIKCEELLAKDRNGSSDPFVTLHLLSTRHQTPVSKRTTNPVFPAPSSTYDFPLFLSLAEKLGTVGTLEIVVWDKDVMRKEYLGELGLGLEEWFQKGEDQKWICGFEDPLNQPLTLPLISTRSNTRSTGRITLKIGFVFPSSASPHNHDLAFEEVYEELLRRSRPSIVSAPPTESIGTIRSHHAYGGQSDDAENAQQFHDDGGLSSSDEEEDGNGSSSDEEEADEFEDALEQLTDSPPPPTTPDTSRFVSTRGGGPVPPQLHIEPSSPLTPTTMGLVGLPETPETAVPSTAKAKAAFLDSVSPTNGENDRPRTSPLQQTFQGGSITPTPTSTPVLSQAPHLVQSQIAQPQPQQPSQRPPQTPTSARSTSFTNKIPRMKFPRKLSGITSSSSSSSSPLPSPSLESPLTPSTPGTPGGTFEKKKRFRRKGVDANGKPYEFGVKGENINDIVGIVMLEVQKAEDLPRLKNMTRTGWDMDPFVVISFGKKVFRTRVIRHSRSPVWDEKLLFHVRKYETSFRVQLTILDWDKLSSNDHIGDASFEIKELIESAPQPDPVTGLYAKEEGGDHAMKEYSLPLSASRQMPWEAIHYPTITFRAKYQPYDALRQRFWRQYLKQYDTDDTGTISHLELTSMLDSLGSTLTRSTIASFFTRNGKRAHQDDLTIEETIQCLETELGRPDSEKRRLDADDSRPDSSVSATPVLMVQDGMGTAIALDQLDFSGPKDLRGDHGRDEKPAPPPAFTTEPMQMPLSHAAAAEPHLHRQNSESSEDDVDLDYISSSVTESGSGSNLAVPQPPTSGKKTRFRRVRYGSKKAAAAKEKRRESESDDTVDSVERVINVKNCPLCHRPRMSSKAEVDIVTHLAVCASQDWNRVDKIVVGNFVTANQAQRKWYTKIISKVSSGDYRLGANSANIIVQNRMTGQLEEEKMQVYVRLGIRLLYKGMKSRMEGGRARRLLKSLSVKQGLKYDSPESARDIPTFIEFHNLNVSEILEPISSFKTFNQFFYRKLKSSARPVESPEDPYRLVSCADCRFMAFETVSEATRMWIKGREFTVSRLLGDAYKGQAEKYAGGALCIFRLAPQDYHRFHSPVDGVIGPMTYIAGEYYTVNPQAIRTALDVYGENARKIVPIDSPQFGRVMAVCVGAMMVGTIQTTVQEGQNVARGEEFGYFAFGGSTIVLLFEKGMVEWDEDLLINGRASLETLVRVGMGIGHGRRPASI